MQPMDTSHMPDMMVAESKKDKDYHLHMSNWIIANRFNWSQQARIPQLWSWYHGTYDPRVEHNFLMVSDSGQPFPVDHAGINEILPKMQFSIGTLIKRGFEVRVEPHSKSAISRRRQGQLQIEVDHNLFPLYADLQDRTGLPIVPPGITSDEKSLKMAMESYKEMGQVVYGRLIDHHIKDSRLEQLIPLAWEQAHVSGSCHIRREVYNGNWITELLPAENVVWDSNAKDPYLSDAWCKGVYEYLAIPDIQLRYNIDRKSLEEIAKKAERSGPYTVGSNQTLARTLGNGGSTKILVVTTYWKDIRKKAGTKSVASNGIPQYHVKDYYHDKRRDRARDQTTVFDCQMVRKAVVIAGEYVPDDHFGVIPNQARSFGIGWNKAQFPISSFVPRMNNGRFVTTMDLVFPAQKIIDRAWVMFQKAMRNDRGKLPVLDEAIRPAGMDFMDQDFYMGTLNAFLVNSRQNGMTTQSMPSSVDLSMSPGANMYGTIMALAKQSLDRLFGFSDDVQGMFNNSASQRTGVAQMAQTQSAVGASALFLGFDEFLARNHMTVIQQDRWSLTRDPESYADIVGDDGIQFVASDEAFAFDEYGVFVNTNPVAEEDRAAMLSIIERGLSTGSINELDSIELLLEKNPRELLQRLKQDMNRAITEKKQMEADMSALQQQQEQAKVDEKAAEREMAMQLQAMESESSIQQIMEKHRASMEEIRRKGEIDLEKAALQQRTSFLRDRMKLQTETP